MKDKNNWKKKVYFVLVVTLIIMALLIPFVFAVVPIEQMAEERQFFSVDSTNKAVGGTLEMSINLDKINYNSFVFTLDNIDKTADIDTSEVENAELKENADSLVITGNKADINVDTIKLYYKIPQDIEVGKKITFFATIEENLGQDNDQETYQDKQTVEITITIVEQEENEDNKQNENNPNTNNPNEQGNKNLEFSQTENGTQEQSKQGQDMQSMSQVSNLTGSALSSSSKSIGSSDQAETVTYNGSSNNYLKSLSIDGYDLTNGFTKENTTYFIKIDEDISSLNVTAVAEDDNAIVCIYGNENVQEGSKILISVTAENGNVRTYRVFATK